VETKDNVTSIDIEKINEIIEFIRESSAKGKFVKDVDLFADPIKLTESNINEIINSIKTSTEYLDIVELKGKQQRYLYSNNEMTENYAKMMFKIEENDLLNLVVETVRNNSKIYPRPTAISVFANQPFNLDEKVFNNIFRKILDNKEYSDIKQSKASNGAVYLYSTKYLTEEHAEALTEWVEVLRFETP
jgi:hypothetical protein